MSCYHQRNSQFEGCAFISADGSFLIVLPDVQSFYVDGCNVFIDLFHLHISSVHEGLVNPFSFAKLVLYNVVTMWLQHWQNPALQDRNAASMSPECLHKIQSWCLAPFNFCEGLIEVFISNLLLQVYS